MKLSICMMVKDEEKNIRRCLESMNDVREQIDSELIIVDTGSVDSTKEIALEYTKKVYFHKWNNDFSGMRNITIDYAKGEWILIIDADEEIENEKFLIDILKKNYIDEVAAFAFTVNNITGNNQHIVSSKSPRLFRNTDDFHYEGIVHNMPKFNGKVIESKVNLLHYGYINTDKELMEKKFKRTKDLLLQALKENPDDIYYNYQLGITYSMHFEPEEALVWLEKSYTLMKESQAEEKSKYVYIQLLKVLLVLNKMDRVIKLSREALDVIGDHIDIYFYRSHALFALKKYDESLKSCLNYIKFNENFSKSELQKKLGIVTNTLNRVDNISSLIVFNKVKLGSLDNINHYLQKVQSFDLIKVYLKDLIYLVLNEGNQILLKETYSHLMNVNKDSLKFIEKWIEDYMLTNDSWDSFEEFYHKISEINNNYGIYCNAIEKLFNNKECIVDYLETNKDFLYPYFKYIFFLLIKYNYSLLNVINLIKVDEIIEFLPDYEANSEYIKKIKNSPIITNKESLKNEFNNKILYIRGVLIYQILISEIKNESLDYDLFNEYLKNGGKLILNKYNEKYLLNSDFLFGVRKDELFHIYIYKSDMNENPKIKIKNLKKSFKTLPELGIYLKPKISKLKDLTMNNEMDILLSKMIQKIENAIKLNQLDYANKLIEELENLNINNSKLFLVKAKISRIEKEYKKSINILIEGIKQFRDVHDLYYELAISLILDNQNLRALLVLKNILFYVDENLRDKVLEKINQLDRKLDFGNNLIDSFKAKTTLCFSSQKLAHKYHYLNNHFSSNLSCIVDSIDKYKDLVSEDNNKSSIIFFGIDNLESVKLKEEIIKDKRIYKYRENNIILEGTDYLIDKVNLSENIQVLISGLSYGMKGVNEKIFSKNALNISLSSNDLYFTDKLIRLLTRVKSIRSSLKEVYINLAYYSFDYRISKTLERTRINRYFPYIYESDGYNQKKEILLNRVITTNKYPKKLYGEYQKTVNSKIFKDANKAKTKKYAIHHSNMRNNKVCDKNIDILSSLVRDLLDLNIKPIIFITPVTQHYYSEYSKKSIDRFYSFVRPITEKFDIPLFDYFDDDRFEVNDFGDGSHLNLKGANKFTKLLKEDFEKTKENYYAK